MNDKLQKEFIELQRLFAQRDLLTEPRYLSRDRFAELLLANKKRMKIKIYEEKSHRIPHIHIDYGRQNHSASYAIESGLRLVGNLPKHYDSDVSAWLERNRSIVLEIWNAMQAGKPCEFLILELAADE